MARKFVTTRPDGVEIRALEEGAGPAVLVVPPGLDDGTSWQAVAERLAGRHRVVRLHRRQYRTDLASGWSIAQEADDVIALAEALAEPAYLVGHSSGAVVALEAMAAAPARFTGAVLYEPPLHLRPAEWDAPIAMARSARSLAGKMTIFLRDIVLLPAWQAMPAAIAVTAIPRMRRLVSRQIDDAVAINELGVRLAAYARIELPVVLLGGTRSPRHLLDRLAALGGVLPDATTVMLDGQGHGAHARAPQRVAEVIGSHVPR